MIADSNAAQDLGAGSDHDVIAEGGMALPSLLPGSTERHALKQRHVIADLGGFPDHDAHTMVDEKPLPDLGGGMNLDAGQETRDLRNRPRHKRNAMSEEPVRHPVRQKRMEAGIGQEDFERAGGSRVPIEYCSEVLSNRSEHTGFKVP